MQIRRVWPVLTALILRSPPKEELEGQMCDFGLTGLSSGGSPDRLDALVWAVTELTAKAAHGPRIRAL